MLDTTELVPAIIIFLVCFFIGLAIEKSSGRETAQRQREEYARNGDAPAHYWIDDSPSLSALLKAVIFWLAGGYSAVTMLFFHNNPLWLYLLFKH